MAERDLGSRQLPGVCTLAPDRTHCLNGQPALHPSGVTCCYTPHHLVATALFSASEDCCYLLGSEWPTLSNQFAWGHA